MNQFNNTPKEARAILCTALRSGEHKQGRGFLCSIDGELCCLGLASEMFLKHEPQCKLEVTFLDGCKSYGGEITDLPDIVCDWLGLATNDGEYKYSSLVALNDRDRLTFARIADIIESEPEGLFVEEVAA